MGLDDEIAAMEQLLQKIEFVKVGDYVLTRHPNLFADFLPHAFEAAKALYQRYVSKVGSTDPDMEYWLAMIEARLKSIQRVKWGDLVLTIHHNAIVDIFKPIEAILVKMRQRLG